MTLRFHVLGRLRTVVNHRPLVTAEPATDAVLAVLLLRHGTVVPDDDLLQAVWGSLPPAGAQARVAARVAELAGLLDPVRPGRLRRLPGGTLLTVRDDELDLTAFQELVRRGLELVASPDPAAGAAPLRQALTMAEPGLLLGLDGAWFARQRAEFDRTVADLRLVHAHAAAGRPYGAWTAPAGWLDRLTDRVRPTAPTTPAVPAAPPAARPPAPDPDVVRFRVLEDLTVTRRGRRVPLGSDVMIRALTALLLRAGTPLDDAELRRAVTGRADPWASGLATTDVGEWLTEIGEVVGPAAHLVRGPAGTTLHVVHPHRLDLAEALELVRRGRGAFAAGEVAAAVESLDAAVDRLPVRPRLPDGAWFDEEARRLRDLRTEVARERDTARRAARERDAGPAAAGPPSAVEVLATRVAAEPLREDLWEAYLTALVDLGRSADAMAEYARMTHLLRQWLGTPPGPALQMLRRRIVDDGTV